MGFFDKRRVGDLERPRVISMSEPPSQEGRSLIDEGPIGTVAFDMDKKGPPADPRRLQRDFDTDYNGVNATLEKLASGKCTWEEFYDLTADILKKVEKALQAIRRSKNESPAGEHQVELGACGRWQGVLLILDRHLIKPRFGLEGKKAEQFERLQRNFSLIQENATSLATDLRSPAATPEDEVEQTVILDPKELRRMTARSSGVERPVRDMSPDTIAREVSAMFRRPEVQVAAGQASEARKVEAKESISAKIGRWETSVLLIASEMRLLNHNIVRDREQFILIFDKILPLLKEIDACTKSITDLGQKRQIKNILNDIEDRLFEPARRFSADMADEAKFLESARIKLK